MFFLLAASSAEERSSSSKLVLVTGVSRGLGRALAIELARRGHTIAGCARNGEALTELEKLLLIPPPSTREDGDGAAASPRKHLLKQVDVVWNSDENVITLLLLSSFHVDLVFLFIPT
jgi:NAD(P)-dependent dehydrogenase (short-subunit alcohol dehydrogenase family)